MNLRQTEAHLVQDYPSSNPGQVADAAECYANTSAPDNGHSPSSLERPPARVATEVQLDSEQLNLLRHRVTNEVQEIQHIYPLTPLQEGMLFHRLLNHRDSYVLSLLIELRSKCLVDPLIMAVQAVMGRHEAFRSAIVSEGVPQAVQIVYRHATLPVQHIDFSDGGDVLHRLRERIRSHDETMDVAQAPLLRLIVASGSGVGPVYAALQVHHLVCDHHSLRVAFSEIVACLDGHWSELPPPGPYTACLPQAPKEVREAQAFFTAKLGTVEEPSAPFGIFDVRADGTDSREAILQLNSTTSRDIRATCERLAVTPARLFHAAWALVVARTSGSDDVVYGTVLASGQTLRGHTESRLGLSVNTLPLRVRLGGLTARQLLDGSDRELRELRVYRDTSLTLAQRCSGIREGTPLFTSILNFRHSEADHLTEAECGVRLVERDEGWTNYPVVMIVDDLGDSFMLCTQTQAQIDPARLARYLETALSSLIQALNAAPELHALSLTVLPDDETNQLLREFNPSLEIGSGKLLLHELFESQVRWAPHSIAVVCEGTRLTYEELNGRANQLARHLRANGVRANELVALSLERSVDLVVGILAILKAGAAYVPLDPSYPAERIAFMLTDATPTVVVTHSAVRRSLAHSDARVISIDEDWQEIARQDTRNLDAEIVGKDLKNLAYVIYTSGSTGKPKGVMVEHANVTRLFAATEHWFHFDEHDVWTLYHSFAFDFSVWELWGALLYGGRLVVVPHFTARSPDDFYRLLCDEGVTVLNQTPSAFHQLMDAQRRELTLKHALRFVVFGGERLDPRMLRPWVERNGVDNPKLINMYGITETTVHVTYCPLGSHEILSEGGSVIGKPIPDLRVYVLDRYRQPAPVGVIGEMYVGGAGVARGYLNRPDLTAERFIHDPFSGESEARLYKTGDLARWRANGTLEYLGRNDSQVKIRGYRIELGEIEAEIASFHGVKSAVVVAREDQFGDKRLLAYIIPDGAAEVGDACSACQYEHLWGDIRSYLKGRIPEHAIPSACVSVSAFPLTPNGKLDWRALPSPGPESQFRRQYEPPRGDVEKTLAGIWQELLQVDRVGRQDNFFELGGHSLLIVQLTERLRQVGLQGDVRRAFESPSLADLASGLTRGADDSSEIPPNLIPPACETITPEMLPLVELDPQEIALIERSVPGGAANIQDIYPLSPLQEGILFHHMLNGTGGDAYARSMLISVPTPERLSALRAALQQVIDRYDVLRTAVLWKDLPRAVQVVCRHATLPVQEIPLSETDDPVEVLRERMKPDRESLDLGLAPLIRLQIAVRRGSTECYALLQTHHFVIDNQSLEVLLSEISARIQGRSIELLSPAPYRNHVAQALANTRSYETEAFFRRKLGDVEEPTAPFGLLDTHGNGTRIEVGRQNIEPELAARVRVQARRLGVSAATLFHAAWGLVVARTSGRNDIVYGTVLLGRLQGSAGAQQILGMFINTLPLRLQLRGVTTVALVEQTQRALAELLSHEHASLAMAQRCSAVGGTEPLFTALLNYRRNTGDLHSQFAEAGMSLLDTHGRTNYPIALSVDDERDGFGLEVETDRRVNPRRVLGYVHTAVESLTEALEHAPDTPAASLEILPNGERHQVLELFNATSTPYPSERLIHQLFEAQVSRAPAAVAVVQDDKSLSYLELNGRANQLARHLRDRGVQVGDYVPIVMPRCLDFVVAQLAILKCGAIYVPVDVKAPAARREFMIRDCGARRLLCDTTPNDRTPHELGLDWITCGHWPAEVARHSVEDLDLAIASAGAPALVMYTSGSTGMPKGVTLPHSGVNRLVVNSTYIRIEASDCVAHGSNPAFDASTLEIWGALLNGARLWIVPDSAIVETDRFAEGLRRAGVTILFQTTALFNQRARIQPEVFSGLRYVLFGGEAADPVSVRMVQRTRSPEHLLNVYGPTETTTLASWYAVSTAAADESNLPIGKPISNTRIYILDDRLQPVPIGVSGELHIGGPGVAIGYLNRPELTSERFIADPFSAEPNARVYKTGDIGRWREDGNIEFVGRNDGQVKIRGFRIEPGEIESRLLRHEQLAEAIVVVREDVPAEKRLVAYVTRRPNQSGPSADELRESLRSHLPDYMIPSAFVFLDILPLTPNGKLDRRALPVPSLTTAPLECYEAPHAGDEEALAGIWKELLQASRVGRTDNFFELGGHSLRALALLFRIRRTFSRHLTIGDIYKSPTLKELARRIGGAEAVDEVVDLSREARLDDDVVRITHRRSRAPARGILLTGSTGFVGRFLLARLLDETGATIYCLVRGRSTEHAAERLTNTLIRYGLWNSEVNRRVVVVPGDLALPKLGITDVAYKQLSEEVDSIYHCGTSMNHLETYAMAKRANVLGVKELLRLAASTNPISLNYISTLGVFSSVDDRGTRLVCEDSPIDFEKHTTAHGYASSKWVGEKLFMLAGARGIPCNIFRLGLVWADAEQGRYDDLQREHRIFRSCLLSGYGIRDYRYSMPPTPVDYVARAVAFLASHYPQGGGLFHIAAAHKEMGGVFERCNEVAGTNLQLLPFYDWISEAKRLHGEGFSLPAVPLIESAFSLEEQAFYEFQARLDRRHIHFDCARTTRQLEDAGIIAPVLDDTLLTAYVTYTLRTDSELRGRTNGDSRQRSPFRTCDTTAADTPLQVHRMPETPQEGRHA